MEAWASKRTPTKLTEALVLSRTRATDLESVKKLNCWASQVQDVSIVRWMPNLEVCSLSVNNLTSLADFAHCPNLQELYIRKNRIQNLSDIHYLKSLQRLRFLWLSDNPCSQDTNYRMTVLRTLPNLQKLDNIAVTEDEINRALEEGDDLAEPEGFESQNPNHNLNANSNAQASASLSRTKTDVCPASPTTCSSSVDVLSDGADYKDEEGDSGVEANHLLPEQSQAGPTFGLSAAQLQKHRLQQQQDSVKLSWEETNHIRAQLGLKPLPMSKVSPHRSVTTGVTKARNANILQSVLLLIRELDKDSLDIVLAAAQKRLADM